METTPNGTLIAPWTKDQVENLEKWQTTGWVHPFTCFGEGDCKINEREDQGILQPTVDGWICPCGKYTQNWATESQLSGNIPPNPLDELLKRLK